MTNYSPPLYQLSYRETSVHAEGVVKAFYKLCQTLLDGMNQSSSRFFYSLTLAGPVMSVDIQSKRLLSRHSRMKAAVFHKHVYDVFVAEEAEMSATNNPNQENANPN